MATRSTGQKSISIRRQLLFSTVLVQSVLVAGFILLLTMLQISGQNQRTRQRLLLQSDLLAQSSTLSLQNNDVEALDRYMQIQRRATTVASAQIVDLDGRAIVHSDPMLTGRNSLGELSDDLLRKPLRRQLISHGKQLAAATPILNDKGEAIGLAVVFPNYRPDRESTWLLVRWGLTYGLLALLVNMAASFLVARDVAHPIRSLLGATEQVAGGAEMGSIFPMPREGTSEVSRLIGAFNDMAETLQKRNTNLNDTLSLLDSMLTNAPVGFAFFDRRSRFVRLNQTMADVAQTTVARHLGRGVREMLPAELGRAVEDRVRTVFETGATQRDVELTAPSDTRTRTWLSNFFPVRAADGSVRWTGLIVTDITERRHTEEMLRRTEKLAAAGRLAASIAHEINNPLEGITNLLYLLRLSESLDSEALQYVQMAQHEVARVSEITQQTLRFHRQSTSPVEVSVPELIQSVLVLYGGKLSAGQVEVQTRFRKPATMFALAGELRQVMANLIGNAIDATQRGGSLLLRVAPGRSWSTGDPGLRVTVADTGSGMDEETKKRIFEPFFTTKEATGTGLGLWVSAEILDKHRAVMKVRSRKRNQGSAGGTVFYVFFPRDGLQTAAAEVSASENQAV